MTDCRQVAAALFAAATLLLPAAAWAEARHSAMIIDANSGAVLYDQAGDELRHPASLTKMMTLYMTFELIEMGRLSYTTPIKVTAEAAAAAPSKLELEPGETIQLIDAIKALVTKSANDMAIAIAQHIGGSEANFARLMTEKARQLGMRSTVFHNASGLPDDRQVTTARDMITLGLHLQDDFPKHYPLFGLRTFTYGGGTYRNHNTLLLSYRGTDGIKTGYTHKSGFNLVANVRRDGRHIIGAIFGGESASSRNAQLRSLLDRALPRASTRMTRQVPPSPLVVAERAAAKAKPTRVASADAPPQPKPAQRPRAAAASTTTPAAAPPTAATAAPPSAPARATAPTAPASAGTPAAAGQPTVAQAAASLTAPATAAAAAAPRDDAPADAAPSQTEAQTPAQPASPAAAAAEKALAAVEAASGTAAAVPQPAVQVADAGAAAANSAPNIAVARVRRVMVAPHVSRPPVAVAEPAAAPATAAATPEAPVTAQAQKSAAAPFAAAAVGPPAGRPTQAADAAPAPGTPPRPRETVLAKTTAAPATAPIAPASAGTGRSPSSFEAQVAALAANIPRGDRADRVPAGTAAPTATVAQPAASTDAAAPPPAAGRPGSTRGEQADAIAALVRGEPPPQPVPQQVAAAVAPPTYRLNGPPAGAAEASARPEPPRAEAAPAQPRVTAAAAPTASPASQREAARPAAPRGGAFQIQIGAFSTPAEAEHQLTNVQGTAGAVLLGHAPLTMPVAKSNRTLYRARFANFDANSAAAACLELRRQQIDCFVMKGE